MSAEEKIFGLMQIWAEIKFNFIYKDRLSKLHWDKLIQKYIPKTIRTKNVRDYYYLLQELVARLDDGHTKIRIPKEIESHLITPPVEIQLIENKFVITNVDKNNEEIHEQKIEIGDEIVSINGIPTHKYFQERVLKYTPLSVKQFALPELLRGPENTSIVLELRKANNKNIKVFLKRGSNLKRSKKFIWKVNRSYPLLKKDLGNGIFYFEIPTFMTEKSVQYFKKEIKSIKKIKGMIIDVRYNTGGNSSNAFGIISCLINKPVKTYKLKTRKHIPFYYARNFFEDKWEWLGPDVISPCRGPKYLGPLVVLINSYSASATQSFVSVLYFNKRALLLGEATAKCTGQPLKVILPGGGVLSLVTSREYYLNGKEINNVEPHIKCVPKLEDIRNNLDPVITKAVNIIENWQRYERKYLARKDGVKVHQD